MVQLEDRNMINVHVLNNAMLPNNSAKQTDLLVNLKEQKFVTKKRKKRIILGNYK